MTDITKPIKWLHRTMNIGDKIVAPLILAASALLTVHIYQVNFKNYPPIINAVVYSPVKTDKQSYRLGETVYGNFIGDRLTDNPVIFNRTLFCENMRAVLTSIRVETPPIGKISGFAPIIALDSSSLLDSNLKLRPATDCVIIFAPESVVATYLLGGERLQPDQSYSTTKFDITE